MKFIFPYSILIANCYLPPADYTSEIIIPLLGGVRGGFSFAQQPAKEQSIVIKKDKSEIVIDDSKIQILIDDPEKEKTKRKTSRI